MTYREAYEKAEWKLERGEITIGEFDELTKPLDEEIRPHGEWIEKHCDYGVYYRCSNCHKMPPNYECDYKEGAIKTNFCPNCGAKMREGEESERQN